MMNKNSTSLTMPNQSLYEQLTKLTAEQFKLFYGMIVYYWANYKFFIGNQNLFSLWCELNQLCHELDESFPDQYENHKEVLSFCKAYPYYFIDRLPNELISHLFAKYIDNHIDILINIAKILHETDLKSAYMYANNSLELNDSIETIIKEAQDHLKYFS